MQNSTQNKAKSSNWEFIGCMNLGCLPFYYNMQLVHTQTQACQQFFPVSTIIMQEAHTNTSVSIVHINSYYHDAAMCWPFLHFQQQRPNVAEFSHLQFVCWHLHLSMNATVNQFVMMLMEMAIHFRTGHYRLNKHLNRYISDYTNMFVNKYLLKTKHDCKQILTED